MRKIILIILMVLLVLIMGLMILVPGIARRYAVNHSKELTGRQFDLERLKVNYFTGTVRLINFTMFEADDQNRFVSFDTLLMKLKPFQLFRDEFVLQRFYLSGLKTTVIQHDSTFNFDDLLAFFQSAEDTVAITDTTDSEPLKYQFSNIEFRNARFEYQNRNIGDTMILKDLSFFIPYIGWNQQNKSEAGLRFNFENEGYFAASVNLHPNTGDYSADITIKRLELEPFYKYSLGYAKLGSLQGSLNTDIRIDGNTDEPEQLKLSGAVDIYDLETTDDRQKPLFSASHIHGRLKDINYAAEYYAFDSLVFYEPYFYVEFYDSTINLIEATDYYSYFPVETDTVEIASVDSSVSVFYYGFDHLRIENGEMDLVDNTTPETFEYNLSAIELSADSVYSTADWVNLYSTMLLNNRGKLTAELGFYPEDPMDLSVDYVITDFLLSDLNIYSRYYMGFPILYGDMNYKSDTKIRKGQLESDNKLIIENVELGEKRGGLVDLPIKFALFLLKDRHGVINLDIPVRGDLNDPSVRVGKIVWNTVKNLIVKVAAAPFDFLAGLISVDPKDIKAIEYDYLDTAFTAARQKQLDLLLELEHKKQGLDIELVYFNDLEKEKGQIAIDEAGKQFAAETGKNYRDSEGDFINFLKNKINAESDSIDIGDVSQKLIPAVRVDSLAKQFEQIRRVTLEKYLHFKSDSTQIRFSIPDPRAPKNIGSLPKFEVKYSMASKPKEKE